jgi:lysophospholipase L1-like esterase
MPIKFWGRSSVTLPPGGELDSDPISMSIVAGAPYAISSYMGPEQTLVAWHRVSNQVNYVSTPGNHAGEPTGDAYRERFTQYVWVDGLSIATQSAAPATAIAAFGDSITDGMRSSLNQNRRWPDGLARRVAGDGERTTSIVNLGISGNRLLSDSPCYGDALVKRFDRDVLERPGVKTTILLIGINDINFAAMPPHAGLDCDFPHTPVTADDLIDGYQRVIAAARHRGVRIFVATLTPASLPPQREQIRRSVNRWIRAGRGSDGVIDFDRALCDLARPERLQRRFDSGDHIHPNDAGYAAMADAVPLATIVDRARK